MSSAAENRIGGRYRTLVADPPWRYDDGKMSTAGAARTKSGASLRYDLMSLAELSSLGVQELAEDNAHLWIWGTNMKLKQSYLLAEAWGFEPITLVTWCKKQPGVGYYLRNNTEHVVFASRGKPQPPESPPISTWYVWPRGEHSVKPDGFFDLVEQVSPGPYLELFARRQRLGWDTWGNEALNHVELSAMAEQEPN